MAEEVNYASVVFKANKASSPPVKKEEETVYDEVKARSEAGEQTADAKAGSLREQKESDRRRQCQLLAAGLAVLCVILVLAIVGLSVYLTLFRETEQATLLDENQNLTNLNNKLSAENQNLMKDNRNLTDQLRNLTQDSDVLEKKISNLSEEVHNLTARNQQLETEKNNLTQLINHMKTESNELNISRAQWSINAYCPIQNNGRQCEPCQKGWLLSQSSCFVFHNAKAPPDQKTWEEARENCTEKKSDLVVIANEEQKESLASIGDWTVGGFWIGLRAEGGKWKWINGSDLTETSWMTQQPADGRCAMFDKDNTWKSADCSTKQQWICQMKALSV